MRRWRGALVGAASAGHGGPLLPGRHSRRRAGRAFAAMPAAPAPVLAQPDHDRGLVFRTLAASALRRGMVAFRGRRGSLPEAAHPTVEGSRPGARRRSEEHTSELQSLMRISYAVFCLKKTNTIQINHSR